MALLSLHLLVLRALGGGMLDPALDDDARPFEYFASTSARLTAFAAVPRASTPTDGLRWSPEGQLAGPRGRLLIAVGEPPRPVHARTATWLDGWLPVAGGADTRHPLPIRLQMLSARVDGLPGEVGLARLVVEGGAADAVLPVACGFVPDAGLPVRWPEPDFAARYAMDAGLALRDGNLLFSFPALAPQAFEAALGVRYAGAFGLADVAAMPTTPVALVRYQVAVPARRTRALTFAMPELDVSPSIAVPAMRRVDFDTAALRTKNDWEAWLETQPRTDFPESKLTQAARAAQVRLHGRAGASLPPLSATERERLLCAETERGLVLVRLSPRYLALDAVLTARRARLQLAGDQPAGALAGLYGLLLHSTATHEFAPLVPASWQRREPHYAYGLPDDGIVSREFVDLCREMLVRTDGQRLRLFAAVSPAWLEPGRSIVARRIPTRFGAVTTRLSVGDGGLEIELPVGLVGEPLVEVRVPWCLRPARILVDGTEQKPDGAWIRVTPKARTVTIAYDPATVTAGPSYSAAVAAYRAEYAERAAAFAVSGGTFGGPPDLDLLPEDERRAILEERYGQSQP